MIEGNFKDVSLPGLLQFLSSEVSKNYRIRITGNAQSGDIYLCKGFVVAAAFGLLEGEDAMCEFLSWPSGTFFVETLTPQVEVKKNLKRVIQASNSFVESSSYLIDNNVGLNTLIVASKSFGSVEWQESLRQQPLEREDFLVLGWIGEGRTMRQALREFGFDIAQSSTILARLLKSNSVQCLRPSADNVASEPDAPQPANDPVIQRFVTTGGQEAAAASVAQAAAMAFAQEATAAVAQDAFITSYKPTASPEAKREQKSSGNPLLNPIKKIGIDLAAVRASMEARLRSRTSRKMPGEGNLHAAEPHPSGPHPVMPAEPSASGSFNATPPSNTGSGAHSSAGYVTAQWMPSMPGAGNALNTVAQGATPNAAAKPPPPPIYPDQGETGELPAVRSGDFPHVYPPPASDPPGAAEAAPAPVVEPPACVAPAPPIQNEPAQAPNQLVENPDAIAMPPAPTATNGAISAAPPIDAAPPQAAPVLPPKSGVQRISAEQAIPLLPPTAPLAKLGASGQTQAHPARRPPPAQPDEASAAVRQTPAKQSPPPAAADNTSAPPERKASRTESLPLVTIDIDRLFHASFTPTQFGKLALTNPALDQYRRQTLLDVEAARTLLDVIDEGTRPAAAILNSYRYCLDRGYIETADSVIPLTADLLLGRMEIDQYLLQRRRINGDQLRDLVNIARKEGVKLTQVLVRGGFLTQSDLDNLEQEQKRFAFK